MFVVKMKIKVLPEILPKILPVLTKNPSKMAFGRIFWKDWKEWKDSGNPGTEGTSPTLCECYIPTNYTVYMVPVSVVYVLPAVDFPEKEDLIKYIYENI